MGVRSDDSGYGEVLGCHNPNFLLEDLATHLAEEDRGLDLDSVLFAIPDRFHSLQCYGADSNDHDRNGAK